MSKATDNLAAAQQRAMKGRPKVGGFPYLAETLRAAGVTKNTWSLPSCQALYITNEGPVISQGSPLLTGAADVPRFDCDALIRAIKRDQAGESVFPDFLKSVWSAGVVRYEVDFGKREVVYYGCFGEEYAENYPAVELPR